MKYQIIACYVDEKSIDKYTIVFNHMESPPFNECLGISEYPNHPQGISQFSGCQLGKHLGKKVKFEKLPEHIKKHIKDRVGEFEVI